MEVGNRLFSRPSVDGLLTLLDASEMSHGFKNLGEKLVGSKVKVWWPNDQMFYEGVIVSFDPFKKKHKVLYVDGNKEKLNLRKERWKFVGGDSEADGGPATYLPSPYASSEMHRKKKLKTNSHSSMEQAKADASSKMYRKKKLKTNSHSSMEQAKADASSKMFGRASINKTKGEATKSGGKSRDDDKFGSKSKHGTPKAVGKSKDDDAKNGGSKLNDDAHTPTGKSKNGTPATVTKSNQDSPKTVTKSKDKMVKGGSKSNSNGTAKGLSAWTPARRVISGDVRASQIAVELSPDYDIPTPFGPPNTASNSASKDIHRGHDEIGLEGQQPSMWRKHPCPCRNGKESQNQAIRDDLNQGLSTLDAAIKPASPTISECIASLNKVAGIEKGSRLYLYALSAFKLKENREVWMSVDDDAIRVAWLEMEMENK